MAWVKGGMGDEEVGEVDGTLCGFAWRAALGRVTVGAGEVLGERGERTAAPSCVDGASGDAFGEDDRAEGVVFA